MVSNENEMLTVFAERGDDVTLQNLGCFFDDHDWGTQLAKHTDVPELQNQRSDMSPGSYALRSTWL